MCINLRGLDCEALDSKPVRMEDAGLFGVFLICSIKHHEKFSCYINNKLALK